MVADAFQIADRVERLGFRAAASANYSRVGVRPNDSNGLQFIFVERKQITSVLQQHHAPPGHFESHLATFLAVGRNANIGLGLVEEPELDRLAENSSDLVIQSCDRHCALVESWKQSVSIHESRRGHFKIKATDGCCGTVMRAAPIRHENAVEPPFFLEDLVVQMIVLSHVSAVD